MIYVIWVGKLKIKPGILNQAAEGVLGIAPEEVEVGVLENMDIMDKAMAGFTIAISIIEAFLNVYNIVETVERYKQSIKVFHHARQQYKDFYQHLHNASTKYKSKQ